MNELSGSGEGIRPPSEENRSRDEASIEYWQGLVREISEERDRFRELAYTDPVTGLPNRRYFEKVVEGNFGRVNSLLVIVDINEFGDINNTYGHDKGDEALRAIAQTLKESVRKDSDVVARLGGDEFAIIGSASPTASEERVVPSLRQRIDPKIRQISSELEMPLGISMGAAIAKKGQGLDFQSVYRRADQNMYREKGEIKKKKNG